MMDSCVSTGNGMSKKFALNVKKCKSSIKKIKAYVANYSMNL